MKLHEQRESYDATTMMGSTAASYTLDRSVTRHILILDRNPGNRRAIRLAIESRFGNVAVAECDEPNEAAEIIARESIDVLLLDAASSDSGGLSDAPGSHPSRMPILVVFTAMEHLAKAVSDFSAADYVIRPFNSDRIALAMRRAFARSDERDPTSYRLSSTESVRPIRANTHVGSAQPADVLLPDANGPAYRRRFLVSIGPRDVIVHTEDLAWVRASGYCATLVLRDRREYLVRLPLDQLEVELSPDEFIRIHRSAIVRFQELQELERSASRSVLAVLRSGARIPVSRSRRDALIRALGGV